MDVKIDSFVTNKTLVFTVTSDGYKYYTWNLYKILQQVKVPWKLCILCLDRESFEFLQKIAMIPCRPFYYTGQHIHHKDPVLFGSSAFKRLNRMKLKALEEFSQRTEIETLLFLDSDIAVFRDPLPYFQEQLLNHPLWFQCDEKLDGSFLCSSIQSCTNPCTGVIVMGLNETTRPLFKNVYRIDDETWKGSVTDQDYIFKRLQATNTSYRTLDRNLIPNGIFLANDKFKDGNPYLLHFNYILGKDKKRFMKQKDCWLLPEYG